MVMLNPMLNLIRKIEGRLQALGENHNTYLLKIWEQRVKGVPQTEPLGLSFPTRTTGILREPCITWFKAFTINPSGKPQYLRNDHGIPSFYSPITVNFGEIRSFDMVQRSLYECSSAHSLFHRNRTHSAPTRLLWIGDDNIRLVLTEKMEQVPAYATLSYCQGLEPFIMLTSKTIDTFLIAIPECELPKTFRDAILIARGLKVSYIWINALCIIQRDSRDWHLEAGRMHSVYGGSQVTIAASSETTVRRGCVERSIDDTNGVHVRITTGRHCRRQHFYKPINYEDITTNSALAKRAWAFQERLLSPRTLHCSALGLF